MKINVVLVEPYKFAKSVQIENKLSEMKQIVKGLICIYYLDENIVIVCNDEGKINGMPLNRAIHKDNKIIEIIAGPFFICKALPSEDTFSSLSDEEINKYLNLFKNPEYFIL